MFACRAHEQAGVLEAPTPTRSLVDFVRWIGEMSRNYKAAEALFLSRISQARSSPVLGDGFDYMDEEDEKAREEGERKSRVFEKFEMPLLIVSNLIPGSVRKPSTICTNLTFAPSDVDD
jgi:hypothetical protein